MAAAIGPSRTNKGKIMTEVKTRDIPLNWDVFVTPGIPTVTSDLPPDEKQQMWSPMHPRALRQDGGNLSGSGQSGVSALAFGARGQTAMSRCR
jgi:hypothetical protein